MDYGRTEWEKISCTFFFMYGNASKNIPYNLFLVSYLTIHASSLCSFRLTNYVFQFHSFLHFHLLILLYSLFCLENFMLMRCVDDVGVSDGCQVHCVICNRIWNKNMSFTNLLLIICCWFDNQLADLMLAFIFYWPGESCKCFRKWVRKGLYLLYWIRT